MEYQEWILRNDFSLTPEVQLQIEQLQKETQLSPVTLRLCWSRGLKTKSEIDEFLSPQLGSLKDPLILQDIRPALDRVIQAKENHEKIRVFGDYDVDGTSGAALLSWFFRDCQMNFDAIQPDRFKEGYGLNLHAVEQAQKDGVRVLITVDCGITSFGPALRAKELGIDLIILDHHHVDDEKGIPEALAVINPQRKDCLSGLKELCGCGVAFYFIRALRSEGRGRKWWPVGAEPNLKQHLDLVVIATAADMVPLVGDNHILTRIGLEVLKNTKKPGVRALLVAAGVGRRDISPGHLGFTIGPRINASGRMSHASLALNLLTTQDPSQAARMANELEQLNQERSHLQNQIWDQVRTHIEAGLEKGMYQNAIMVGDPSWHEGVVGIVASKVTEFFKKPAAVVALRDDFGKGSVRSFGGKNILEVIHGCQEFLLGFGGHKYAAGFSVALDRFEALVQCFDQKVGELKEEKKAQALRTEGHADWDELSFKTFQEIEKLGPFGPGNPEPIFEVEAHAVSHQVLKGRHLKMNLAHVQGGAKTLEAIWFHAAEKKELLPDILKGQCVWAATPEINRFRGSARPTLRIKDRRDLENR